MSGATRRQDVMIRISGIFEFIDPNHLGFQESEVTLPQGEVGLQESGQEAGAAGTDCSNLHFHRPRRSPFFWNPAPLMQNYMIKSVKMTKKSILRDQFSWKVRNFAPVFSKRHHLLLLNYPTELRPRKGFIEQNPNSYWSCAPQRRLHHNEFGAVAGLVGYMERGLRFLYAFELVLSPQDLRDESNNKISNHNKKTIKNESYDQD